MNPPAARCCVGIQPQPWGWCRKTPQIKRSESKGSAVKVVGGSPILFSCNTMAISKIFELWGDNYVGTVFFSWFFFFLNAAVDLWNSLLWGIGAVLNGQKYFWQISPFLLHFDALAFQCCLCKWDVPHFRPTLPTMVETAHLQSGNPENEHVKILFLMAFRKKWMGNGI